MSFEAGSSRSLVMRAVAAGSALAAAAALAGCREPDRPLGPEAMGWIAVDSDPRGALIVTDGQNTGLRTPDTVKTLSIGEHRIAATMDTARFAYSYTTVVRNRPDTVISVTGPLLARCVSTVCAAYVQPNRIRFAFRPVPTLFFVQGQGEGLFWPGDATNSYASGAAPVIAGIVAGGAAGDTLALGPYDLEFFAARPAVGSATTSQAVRISVPSWILPPGELIAAGASVPRGLSVRQQLFAPTGADGADMLFVRVTIENIANSPLYRLLDPRPGTLTLREAWLGFAFDFDIGLSDDDLVTYVPDIDLAIGYDSDFREASFQTEGRDRPALLGLRMIEPPPGARQVLLIAWERGVEWAAAQANQRFGWQWLSGTQDPTNLGNHPDPRMGYAPAVPADLRMGVSAGPLALAPGDSVSFTVVLLLASPVPGTFVSGQLVEPGDPLASNRKILQVAGTLVQKAKDATGVWQRLWNGGP